MKMLKMAAVEERDRRAGPGRVRSVRWRLRGPAEASPAPLAATPARGLPAKRPRGPTHPRGLSADGYPTHPEPNERRIGRALTPRLARRLANG